MGGCGGKGSAEGATEPPLLPSVCEALLFATMCIVGLPVEVQVKDGSVYSGIFHTASVEKEYGIVLKKAKKIVTRNGSGNVGIGAVVDTLVVLSADLVQVIAKGVLLTKEGTALDVLNDGLEAVAGPVQLPAHGSIMERRFEQDGENNATYFSKIGYADKNAIGLTNGRKSQTKTLERPRGVGKGKENGFSARKNEEASNVSLVSSCQRQVEECKSEGEAVLCNNVHATHLEKHIFLQTCSPNLSTSVLHLQGNPTGHTHKRMPDERHFSTPTVNITVEMSDNEVTTTSDIPVTNSQRQVHSTSAFQCITCSNLTPRPLEVPASSPLSAKPVNTTCTKEFKLNPGAKTFSPSFASPHLVLPAISNVANISYVPNTYTMVPVATAQPAIDIGPSINCSPVQTKFVQHVNVPAGNTIPVSQFSHPISGHMGARVQPLRLGGQYSHVQTTSPFLFPNSQLMTGGRRGQIIYVHPLPQDSAQGIPAFPQVPAHSLLTPYPANPPKLQGNAVPPVQVYVTSPVFPGGQQLPTIPVQIPFSDPLPSFQAVQVPGTTNFFTGKF